jgi:hypothetical protein
MISEQPPGDPPVIVVTGLPRSGTSMMMQMLEAGGLPVLSDGLRRADEDNPLGYYEFEPVKRLKHDASWLPGARGKAVKMVYLLLRDLPDMFRYKVILMRRNLVEVVASQDAMLSRLGGVADPEGSERLIRLFEEQLRLTRRWLAARDHFQVLDVDYHQVLADTRGTCARICEFLGGALDADRMRAVVTPSLYRQRALAPNAAPGDSA